MRVVIAMSGGVDSSVAAYLLKEKGFDVVGLSFELWDRRDVKNLKVCCSVETIEIAKTVAKKIGIEHYTVDVRDAFYKHVIENFCDSYISGLTPNPCILCNKYIKFDFLLKKAEEIGAEIIATGHYARIKKTDVTLHPERRHSLLKGVDLKKDQSYVLYAMTQNELSKTLFPLGGFQKEKVREIAREAGLASALRAESQEICFVGNGDYAEFIKDFNPQAVREGPIVNAEGRVVGTHKGIACYTVGQRKGLNISSSKPFYVVDINRGENMILIGSREDAMKKTFRVKELNYISMESLSKSMRAHVKVRSNMKEMPATVFPLENQRVLVEFDEPQWAPAPGQSAVFYNGDIVVGGGIIEPG